MAKNPAMPVWTDAYLADTRHLTTVQHGAYFLLLMEAWRRPRCNLPDDDSLLAKLAGLSTEEWETHRPIVMAFWRLDKRARTFTQKRQLKERKYVNHTSARQRSASKSMWNKKKVESHGSATPMPNASQSDAPTPTPTPTVSKNGELSWPALETRLREAAKWDKHPSSHLLVVGPIAELLKSGADLDLDVLPVVRRDAGKCDHPTWKFFVPAIKRATADRRNAGEIPDIPRPLDRRNLNGHSRAARLEANRDRNLAVLGAIVAEAERREEESGSSSSGNDNP